MRVSTLVLGLLASFCIFLPEIRGSEFDAPYRPFNDLLKSYNDFVDRVYNYLRADRTREIAEPCGDESDVLLTLAESGDARALKFLDATGKIDSGVLEGGVQFLGSYSECLRANIQNESLNHKISGKYCLVQLSFSNASGDNVNIPQASWTVLAQSQKKPAFGICIPSSCHSDDVLKAVQKSGMDTLDANTTNVLSCSENKDFSSDPAAIGILSLFMFFICLTLCATGYDALCPYFKNEITLSCEAIYTPAAEAGKTGTAQTYSYSLPEKCLLSFSLLKNMPRLLTVQSSAESGSKTRTIDALHGIRFFTMALIIMMHTYSFAMKDLYFRNSQMLFDVPKQFASQFFANGTLTVDTFYVMSGLLVTYITLRMMERQQMKFNLAYFILHRIVRLSPLLLMVLAFCATLLNYIGSGPNWHSSITMYDDWCKQNWWLNALYLQNFINTEHMCLGHTWYLATDFQFYIIIIPVLILLLRNVVWAYVLIGLYFIVSVVITFTLTLINNYPAVPYMNDDVALNVVNDYYKQVYIKPYCRIGPYLLGVLLGYLFYMKRQIHLKKVHVALAWAGSVLLVLFIVFIMFGANKGQLPSAGFAATYSAFARSIWAVGIGWLSMACAYGYGGFINDLLSWKALVPLSRMTYSAYLIHPVVVEVYYGCVEVAMEFSYTNMLYITMGNLVCTYSISFVLTLMFELPFGALETALLSRKPT